LWFLQTFALSGSLKCLTIAPENVGIAERP
jgi:hypothetical protein